MFRNLLGSSIILIGGLYLSLSLVLAGTGCLDGVGDCNIANTMTVTLTPGDLCIGSDGEFDFGDMIVGRTNQTIQGVFTNPFWVQDMRGDDTGYYTTVQMAGPLQGPGSSTIPASNISLHAPHGITTLAGSPNPYVIVDTSIAGGFQTLDTARTLIKRDSGINMGTIGQYGTIPSMRLVVPAFQSVGNYTGTLVYTLYEENAPTTTSYPPPDQWTDTNYFVMNITNTSIIDYTGPDGIDIIIPAEINGVAITSIGNNAFRDNNITSVTIPNSVTIIGQAAFLSNQLTSLTIPDSVTTIGVYAFRNNQLTSVTIPDSVTTIGLRAFLFNNLTSITLPHSITSLASEAFRGNGTNSNSLDDIPRSPISESHGTRNLVGTSWIKQ